MHIRDLGGLFPHEQIEMQSQSKERSDGDGNELEERTRRVWEERKYKPRKKGPRTRWDRGWEPPTRKGGQGRGEGDPPNQRDQGSRLVHVRELKQRGVGLIRDGARDPRTIDTQSFDYP